MVLGGITPAHAGKSTYTRFKLAQREDHPRACGEKADIQVKDTPPEGSPPRMRGKACSHAHAHHERRITPAHAGKRGALFAKEDKPLDHPRACGEKLQIQVYNVQLLGSPPRMRGKGLMGNRPDVASGITPAHAGKSIFYSFLLYMLWDHPRACGEKRQNRIVGYKGKGSPPRMRGKALHMAHFAILFRITPAHAGKSGSIEVY